MSTSVKHLIQNSDKYHLQKGDKLLVVYRPPVEKYLLTVETNNQSPNTEMVPVSIDKVFVQNVKTGKMEPASVLNLPPIKINEVKAVSNLLLFQQFSNDFNHLKPESVQYGDNMLHAWKIYKLHKSAYSPQSHFSALTADLPMTAKQKTAEYLPESVDIYEDSIPPDPSKPIISKGGRERERERGRRRSRRYRTKKTRKTHRSKF